MRHELRTRYVLRLQVNAKRKHQLPSLKRVGCVGRLQFDDNLTEIKTELLLRRIPCQQNSAHEWFEVCLEPQLAFNIGRKFIKSGQQLDRRRPMGIGVTLAPAPGA